MVGRLGVNGGRAQQLVALENNIEKDLVPNLVRIMEEKHALARARRPDTVTLTLVQVCTSQSPAENSLLLEDFASFLHNQIDTI